MSHLDCVYAFVWKLHQMKHSKPTNIIIKPSNSETPPSKMDKSQFKP